MIIDPLRQPRRGVHLIQKPTLDIIPQCPGQCLAGRRHFFHRAHITVLEQQLDIIGFRRAGPDRETGITAVFIVHG
ncbi:hypothetical protein [Xenorhabdus griffiniae]|uniref:hypothetical protein n=1 Tax=Xenorhabdus griffiniae TaxID=351672 RepID=UPI001671DC4C|nr:hypothetical protein [Xenorhabdus griffiniae]MBD1226191.1 hypothetical protein [Xenorhabdus griffiniae]